MTTNPTTFPNTARRDAIAFLNTNAALLQPIPEQCVAAVAQGCANGDLPVSVLIGHHEQTPQDAMQLTLRITLPVRPLFDNKEPGALFVLMAAEQAGEFVRALERLLTGASITCDSVALNTANVVVPEPTPQIEPLRAFSVDLLREARLERKVTEVAVVSLKKNVVVLATSQDEAERIALRDAYATWESADTSMLVDDMDTDDAEWEVHNAEDPTFDRWHARESEVDDLQELTDANVALSEVERAENLGVLIVEERSNPDGTARDANDEVMLLTDTIESARAAREADTE